MQLFSSQYGGGLQVLLRAMLGTAMRALIPSYLLVGPQFKHF
jgi:hypothetical protein